MNCNAIEVERGEQGKQGLPGKGINIPTPQLKIGEIDDTKLCSTLFAYYLPMGNEDFEQYQPKYYLFMQKARRKHKKKIAGVQTKLFNKGGFVHPTHLNGVNFGAKSAYYGGETKIPMHTEFGVNATGAYVYTQLGMDPFEFVEWRPDNSVPYAPMLLANFGDPITKFKFRGKVHQQQRYRSSTFVLAIGILNPDTNVKNPIIFGDFSEPFRLQFIARKGTPSHVTGLRYVQIMSSIKRKIT